MFAVLEYFKLRAHKPTNLSSFFFQLTIILHVVYLWGVGGWWGVGWVWCPRTREYKSIKQTIRFLSNGKVSLLYYWCYVLVWAMINRRNHELSSPRTMYAGVKMLYIVTLCFIKCLVCIFLFVNLTVLSVFIYYVYSNCLVQSRNFQR